MKPLASWIKDFHKRVQFIRDWAEKGQPAAFWLPGFFFPQGFLTGVLQNHSRKYQIPIDTLTFTYSVTELEEGDKKADDFVKEDGVSVYGLFMEGARWDRDRKSIQDSYPMEMFSVRLR